MEKEIICTVCPQGCRIQVSGTEKQVETVAGFGCPRGEKYAAQEFICPMRILTASVRLENGCEPLLPVRSAAPIPREAVAEAIRQLQTVKVTAPVTSHQTIVANILNTGVDIIASAAAGTK